MDAWTESFMSSIRPSLERYATFTATPTNRLKVLLLHGLIVSSFVATVWPFDLFSNPQQVLADSSFAGSANADCFDRVRIERELHLLPIQIVAGQSDHDTTNGFISKSTLHKTLGLQNHLTAHLADSANEWQCVQTSTGSCLVHSPLALWNSSESMLLSDPDTLESWSQQAAQSSGYVSRVLNAIMGSPKQNQLVLTWPIQSTSAASNPVAFARDVLAEYGTLHTAQSHEQKILLRVS